VTLRVSAEHGQQNTTILCQTSPSKPPGLLHLLFNGQTLRWPAFSFMHRSRLQLIRRHDGLVMSRVQVQITHDQVQQLARLVQSSVYEQYYDRLLDQLRPEVLQFASGQDEEKPSSRPVRLLSAKSLAKASMDPTVSTSGQIVLQCATTISQPLITSYTDLTLQPEAGWLPAEVPTTPQLQMHESYPSPSIYSQQPRWQQRTRTLLLNCTAPVPDRSQPKPLLQWYINDRDVSKLFLHFSLFRNSNMTFTLQFGAQKARPEELLLYDYPELYDDELREFAYTYHAYSVDRWTKPSVTVGLRLQLDKEHFQVKPSPFSLFPAKCSLSHSFIHLRPLSHRTPMASV
jgi:hypothetical protein